MKNLHLANQLSTNYKGNLLSFKNFINLTHLTCNRILITDAQMQEICKNLKHLIHLDLNVTFESDLTDYGFTGEKNNFKSGYSISNLTNLKVLDINTGMSWSYYNCLSDVTLRNIMKIKGLEYLYISCKDVHVKVSVYDEYILKIIILILFYRTTKQLKQNLKKIVIVTW